MDRKGNQDTNSPEQEAQFRYYSQKRIPLPDSSTTTFSQMLASSQGYSIDSSQMDLQDINNHVAYPVSVYVSRNDPYIGVGMQPLDVGNGGNTGPDPRIGSAKSDCASLAQLANDSYEADVDNLFPDLVPTPVAVQYSSNPTPPLSAGPVDDSDGNGDQGPFLYQMVKAEPPLVLETPQGSVQSDEQLDQFHYDDGDGVDSSSSQDDSQSQGNRIPLLDSFPGLLNFTVTPELVSNKQQCVYLAERNKIYCKDNQPVMFNINLDFTKANVTYRQLKVQAVIYFTANALVVQEAVKQCSNCQKLEKNPPLDENGHSIRGHVIRCDSAKAVYKPKRKIHRCVEIPLEKVQGGSTKYTMKRNYKFMCLSSCPVKEKLKESRDWTLMFYLRYGTYELGRQAYNLKICKCPGRDSTSDRNKWLSTQLTGTRPRNFKQEVPDLPEDSQDFTLETNPKRPRLKLECGGTQIGITQGRSAEPGVAANIDQAVRPSTSRAAYGLQTTQTAVVPAKRRKRHNSGSASVLETDSEPFSQEGSQSVRNLGRKTLDNINWVALEIQRSNSDEDVGFYKDWLKMLSYHNKQLVRYRGGEVATPGPQNALLLRKEDGDASKEGSQ